MVTRKTPTSQSKCCICGRPCKDEIGRICKAKKALIVMMAVYGAIASQSAIARQPNASPVHESAADHGAVYPALSVDVSGWVATIRARSGGWLQYDLETERVIARSQNPLSLDLRDQVRAAVAKEIQRYWERHSGTFKINNRKPVTLLTFVSGNRAELYASGGRGGVEVYDIHTGELIESTAGGVYPPVRDLIPARLAELVIKAVA